MKTKHFWQLREKKDCIFSPYLGMKHFAEKYFLATRINFIPGRKKFVSVETNQYPWNLRKNSLICFLSPSGAATGNQVQVEAEDIIDINIILLTIS